MGCAIFFESNYDSLTLFTPLDSFSTLPLGIFLKKNNLLFLVIRADIKTSTKAAHGRVLCHSSCTRVG